MKANKLLLTVLVSIFSCGRGTQENQSHISYLILEGSPGLTRFVKEPKITLCANMKYVTEDVKPALIKHLTDATLKWIEPMRALATEKLASKVEIGFWSSTNGSYPNNDPLPDGCHAGLIILKNRRPGVQVSPNRTVLFFNTDVSDKNFRVTLHEFGHAFGLRDTYSTSEFNTCLPGQPDSVMCNTEDHDELQPDDIEGIREVYKRTSLH
jgi:hypothetical protein